MKLRVDRLLALGGAAACLAAAIWLGLHRADEARLARANELAARGDAPAAIREAEPITRRPTLADALVTRAYAAITLHRYGTAAGLLERAAELEPNDWKIEHDLARTLQALGRRRAAQLRMERALDLSPD